MEVASGQPDLELLASKLEEHLRAEISSGEFYKVKCAAKNDRLMTLIQHPQSISADTDKIFAVLEEALKSLLTGGEHRVELFCRVDGTKLPYSKTKLSWTGVETSDIAEVEVEAEVISTPNFSTDDLISPTPSPPESSPEEPKEEPGDEVFDPLADAPDLTSYPKSKNKLPLKTLIVGGVLLMIAALGGGYAVTRPCVLSQCQEIQTAQQLQANFQQLKGNPQAQAELASLKAEMELAITSLQTIPSWSSRHQQAQQLQADLSTRVKKINLVLKAFQTGKQAAQTAKNPSSSLKQLQNRQRLWRQAITPLEAISPKSELYKLVQPKLFSYRQGLQTVNQQLLAEEKWQKKLTDAKAVAIVAEQRQNSAKTLPEVQKARSTWQVVVNALISIPRNSAAYSEAQQLLDEYKPKLANARVKATKELLASKTYNQAVSAANSAKAYEKQNQWSAAVANWNQAVSAVKRVASDSFYYRQAQPLLESYTKSLKQAEQQLNIYTRIQQARTDLVKTCSNNIRICTYTVTQQAIAVRITPEYARAISVNSNITDTQSYRNNVNTITNHLQIVQKALEVISDNAGIPLTIYDHLGNQTYVHKPRG
ncbi:MAG: hypothetical protein QNJ47_14860 [Nostocaceae cyanobacterium]|nr:hypothetical protein [Nostocaceae cyanobacterium]